ncbi:aldehyde dehydrogenase family protein [Novosphingobium sp. JCM 18896]|uniref:aldehyde dehydrogenase family protein n=1 Tax=Novosphingobium sp. JCM 18896 TaxID=2989731 RepID=UPI0022222EE2|nr:aldehyde dehydrogenase family protein [Novosphingobium sp. JCM 18896]MCW1428037.1 aldehyde dehydrogenase family protein [Novosphingobium sp. JCM 18896]
MREHLQQFIGGHWVDSQGGTRHEVINPATEEPCTVITLGTAADVDAAVKAARAAFPAFAATSVAERLALIDRVIEVYKSRLGEVAQAISEEMGAPISFATAAQAPTGIGHLKSARNALEGFEWEEEMRGARVVHEAIGVVGMITPWNWPINQIVAKVAPCLAAGNTMVLKPSEECPTNAVIFAEILAEAGVPAGVFNLVNGDGPGVGAAIASHSDIDMVSFTGSTRAGVAVAQAAAPTVKRVHQELGGKGPNLVLPNADIDAHLGKMLSGVVGNSGQTCIAPTRVIVSQGQKQAVESFAKAMFEATPVGDPAQEGGHIGPVVNKSQFDKIQALIQSAIDEGATLLAGGTGMPDSVNRGYYVRPTVFGDVTPDMRIFREETFGPVATISTYETLDEGIALANDTEYGLSAAITGDEELAKGVARRLRAGLVGVNAWGPVPDAPFGGYKRSGNGREAGAWGLRDFLEVKSIVGG